MLKVNNKNEKLITLSEVIGKYLMNQIEQIEVGVLKEVE